MTDMDGVWGSRPRFLPHNTVHGGKKWSAAVYVRLSDEDRNKTRRTDMSQSIQNQIRYLENYAEMMNGRPDGGIRLEIYRVYCDDDCTGMNFDRGGFRQMMRDIESNLTDCILVKSLSRLGRNDRGMQQYLKEEFEQYGREVRVCAVGDGYDSLYRDPMDIELRFKLMMNEQYSQTQHINVMIGMHTMQKQGKYVGAFAPYGYQKDPGDKHHFIVDKTACAAVKRIYREYLGGKSPKEIARGLTEDGIANPSVYKRMNGSSFVCGKKISWDEKHWTGSSVKRILMDEVYTGTIVQHKRVKNKLLDQRPAVVPKQERIRVCGMHEPIIPKTDWEAVQGMMRVVRRNPAGEDEAAIFKGLLKCGDCGHAMRKRWDVYRTKGGERHRYLYYNCGTYRDYGKTSGDGKGGPGCSCHYISDQTIRSLLLDDINQIIASLQNLPEIVHRQRKEELPGHTAKKRLVLEKGREEARIRERLIRARNKWLDGEMTQEEYEETRRDNRERIEALRAEAAEIERQMPEEGAKADCPWVRELLRNGRLEEIDRVSVVKLISGIEVYEGRTIKIIYRFAEGCGGIVE